MSGRLLEAGRGPVRLALGLVVVLQLLRPAPATHSQAGAVIRCRLEMPQLVVGAETTLLVSVQNVSNLYGYQLELGYNRDAGRVEVQDADTGRPGVNLALGGFLSPDFIISDRADNSAGLISLAVNQMSPSPAREGSGALARAAIRGVRVGAVNFRFQDVVLSDPDGNTLPHQVGNCALNVIPSSTATLSTRLYIPLIERDG